MNARLSTAAVFLVGGLMLACGGAAPTGPAAFPDVAPTIANDWRALAFEPMNSPPSTAPFDGDGVADVQALLASTHPDETFVVTRLRGSTQEVLGYGGGAGGEFLAMPQGRPNAMFGGHVRLKRHNFDCARALAPLIAWADDAFPEEVFHLSHRCLKSDEEPPVPHFEVLDGSGWPAAAVLDVWEDRIARALNRFAVRDAPILRAQVSVVVHPKGSTEALRPLRGARTEDQERYASARASSSWADGTWTRGAPSTFERSTKLEAQVDAAIRPFAPDAVRFEVFRRGRPDASLDDIATQPFKRQAVTVRTWVNEPVSPQLLSDWTFAAQKAVDPRVLLFLEVTVCEAGVTHPWTAADRCSRGWDDWTLFTVGDPRKKPDRPVLAPGVSR